MEKRKIGRVWILKDEETHSCKTYDLKIAQGMLYVSVGYLQQWIGDDDFTEESSYTLVLISPYGEHRTIASNVSRAAIEVILETTAKFYTYWGDIL